MTAEAQAAIDKLKEDRKIADAIAAATNSKRRRLFGGSSGGEVEGEDATNGGSSAAAAAAATSSSAAALSIEPSEFRGEKYARAEAVIHDLLDSDDEEEPRPLSQSTSSYFTKVKSGYDPLAEAKELERSERHREREAERAKEAKGISNADFKRWQEREAKKKAMAGKVGRGSGTVKEGGGAGKKGSGSSARKPRKRAPKERDSDGDFQDADDDDFIADDEDVEEEMEQARLIKAAERKAAAKRAKAKTMQTNGDASGSASGSSGAEDDDGEEDDDGSSSSDDGGPRFDEDGFEAEEALEKARFESAMTPTDAFESENTCTRENPASELFSGLTLTMFSFACFCSFFQCVVPLPADRVDRCAVFSLHREFRSTAGAIQCG